MALTLEALQIVDLIARRGSFAAAAAELGKVPSALTYTVRRLEDELDVLLFDRRGRRALLTTAGQALLDDGRPLLRAADDLASRVRRVASGWEVELAIGVDAMIAFDALAPLIRDFHAAGAPTRLRLSNEVLEGGWDALLAGRVDLVLGAANDSPAVALSGAYGVRPLGTVDFVFCVAPHHPLARHEGPVDAAALRRHRAVALADTARGLPTRTSGLLSGQDLLTVATLEQKLAAQVAGLGCGWLPAHHARAALADGRLVALPVAEPRAPAQLHYAWKKAGPGKALQWWLARLDVARVREALLA